MMLTRGYSTLGWFCGGVGFMYPWGWLIGAAVLIAAVVLLAVLVGRKKRKPRSDDALEALKLRYIKGEISEEDYQKMKEVVGK